MAKTGRGVGGAATPRTRGGAGSSPAVPTIKATSKKVLRRMLSDLDRKLSRWDRLSGMDRAVYAFVLPKNAADLDRHRRNVRERIKSIGRED